MRVRGSDGRATSRCVPGATSRDLADLRRRHHRSWTQGLGLAYELGRRGFGRIAVLDSAYPGAGASGRNGEMIRSAFASRSGSACST